MVDKEGSEGTEGTEGTENVLSDVEAETNYIHNWFNGWPAPAEGE